MSQHSDALLNLKNHLRDINGLRSAISLMYWDQATYLPEQAAESRGEALGILNKISHEMETSQKLGQWLHDLIPLEAELAPDSDDACLIRVAREDHLKAVRIPTELAVEMSAHASRSYEAWKKARASENFALVADELKKNIELSRRFSECLKMPGQTSILDPLIDLFDPGFSVTTVRPLFSSLREKLVPLLEQLTHGDLIDDSCLKQNFPERDQYAFGEKVIGAIGYDFERGRQDKTHHPFMTRISGSDVRITTRCKENDFSEALFSTIHEAGHALYEFGIDRALEGTPLAQGASSGIHESQSRLWENLVGRSLPFWQHFYPALQTSFPNQLGSTPLPSFYRAINRVERGLIRTDADEVSYNLHVMVRFDLELDLLEGRLEVKDLPEAWIERYRMDLGVQPTTLADGVLQDVHWFHGVLGGAFQGYAIGNVLSAQLFAAARRSLPNLEEQIRTGQFSGLRQWLRRNLHRYGRKLKGPDLIRRATGRELDTEDYLSYLESKYQAL